jgi:hypothetical protein
MLEVIGDLFTYNPTSKPLQTAPNTVDELLQYKPSHGNILRCITTNGIVKSNGDLVMGAGIAKEASRRYMELPHIFGDKVDERGNHVYIIEKYGIASFPTKNHWRDPSDINLIAQSCRELVHFGKKWEYILLPRPGCGLGGLDWDKQVRPLISHYFKNDKFIIVHPYQK